MKQATAEKNTMSAGEVGFEITETCFDELADKHYDVPLLVKIGTAFYAVTNFQIKGPRADGSYVGILTASEQN